jgi:hypothetical protein
MVVAAAAMGSVWMPSIGTRMFRQSLDASLGAALENFLSKKSFQTVFFVSAML